MWPKLPMKHISAIFIEIAIPCFFGAHLQYKSDKLTEAVFESNWIEQNLQFKQLLLMFGQGTIRPIRISAGGLFDLNLSTFLSVTNHISDRVYIESSNKKFLSLGNRLFGWPIQCLHCSVNSIACKIIDCSIRHTQFITVLLRLSSCCIEKYAIVKIAR